MRLTSNAAGRWRFESFGELIGYDGENLAYQVRIAVDESVVEVMVNGKWLTARIYPTK